MAPTDVHSDDTLHIAAMQQPHPSVVAVAMTTDDVTGHVSFSSFVGPRFRVALMARQEADALIGPLHVLKSFLIILSIIIIIIIITIAIIILSLQLTTDNCSRKIFNVKSKVCVRVVRVRGVASERRYLYKVRKFLFKYGLSDNRLCRLCT